MKNFLFQLLLFISFASMAQESDKKINDIANDACDCISKIDLQLNQEEKSNEIKECISGAIMSSQMQEKLFGLLNKTKDTLNKIDDVSKMDSLVVKDDIDIVLNDEENYPEVEAYLYDNCPAMKNIYFNDNQTHANSYSDRKKAMKFYEQGQAAFAREEYLKAITLFNKAVQKDEKFAFAWDNLGYSYRKIGNYKMAIECYQKSLKLDPKGKMPLMNLPVAYELDNDIESAIIAYKKYLEIYEDDPEAPYGLGRMHIYKEEYGKALEYMIQAYILYVDINSPYNIDAQKNIQLIYNKMKQQDQLDLFHTIAKKYNLQVNEED